MCNKRISGTRRDEEKAVPSIFTDILKEVESKNVSIFPLFIYTVVNDHNFLSFLQKSHLVFPISSRYHSFCIQLPVTEDEVAFQ